MTIGGADSVYLSRNAPELTAVEACSGTLECALVGVADQFLVALWLLMLVAVALASLLFLPRARELCEQERERTRSEYEAFDEFVDRLRDISPANAASAAEPAGGMPIVHREIHPGLDGAPEVCNAYRETVMSVPHFEEEYNESIDEHMGAEFSDELAHATLDASNFGRHVKRGLLQAAVDARDRREQFLSLLEDEASSLERHEGRLEEIAERVDRTTAPLCADQTYDELTERRERLSTCEQFLEDVIEQRQSDRNESQHAVLRRNGGLDLQEYLYRPMDVTYPVMSEAAELLSRVAVARRRVQDELIYRA